MICVEIDELTACLTDATTGERINTEVIRIMRKSMLSNFNKENGWYVSWVELLEESEIYALVIAGTFSIQGLIAVSKDENSCTAFINWAVASPENNKLYSGYKKYLGVGGHLFAIAAEKSVEYGYGGAISGFAANSDLVNYYEKEFHAQLIGRLHPYQIFIDEADAQQIREVYDYEWTEEAL